MPRKTSGPGYYKSRNGYYCEWNGRQYLLAKGPKDEPNGPTYLEALEVFKGLMQKGNIEKGGDGNQLQDIFDEYIERYAKVKMRRAGVDFILTMLRPFQQKYGAVKVSELTHSMLEKFIAEQRKPRRRMVPTTLPHLRKKNILEQERVTSWGDATVLHFLEALNMVFNWAKSRKPPLVESNPVEGFEKPRGRSASRERYLEPDELQRVMAFPHRYRAMRNLIIALEATGARPGELINAKTTDWNDRDGAIVYFKDDRRREDEFQHKTAGYKDRVIIFPEGQALDLVRELVRSAKPGSYIFPSPHGKKYLISSVGNYFRHVLRPRLNMPHLTPYSFRHTFATRWLLVNPDIYTLAEQLGNTPTTIERHYAHLCRDRNTIRAKLEQVRLAQNSAELHPGLTTDLGAPAQSA